MLFEVLVGILAVVCLLAGLCILALAVVIWFGGSR